MRFYLFAFSDVEQEIGLIQIETSQALCVIGKDNYRVFQTIDFYG